MQIRQLAEGDAAAYHALRLRALREHPEAFTSSFEEDCLKPVEWARKRLAASAEAPHDFVLGAFAGGVLAGIVGLSVEPRAKIRHKAHLFGMYVAPEHAGSGTGRALLLACIERCRAIPGVSQVQLTVTETNARAKSLYESAGFVAYGLERHAVKLGNRFLDKCHMALSLGDAPTP